MDTFSYVLRPSTLCLCLYVCGYAFLSPQANCILLFCRLFLSSISPISLTLFSYLHSLSPAPSSIQPFLLIIRYQPELPQQGPCGGSAGEHVWTACRGGCGELCQPSAPWADGGGGGGSADWAHQGRLSESPSSSEHCPSLFPPCVSSQWPTPSAMFLWKQIGKLDKDPISLICRTWVIIENVCMIKNY